MVNLFCLSIFYLLLFSTVSNGNSNLDYLNFQHHHQHQIRDTSHHILSRQKRWLIWKEGANWVSVIFGIGIPVDLKYQSLTLGMVVKAFYLLPNNSTTYTHPSITIERKKRSPTRWMVYEMIENYLERNNYGNGKICLLKSICEIASIPLEQRTGLLAEIVHSILTPSTTDDAIEDHSLNDYHAAEQLGKDDGNCDRLYPECPIGPLEQFSRFLNVNKYFL